MTVRIEAVNGSDVAEQASLILREVWQPPAVHYSPAYLQWQLTFPTSVPMPALIGYDDAEPVGFIAMTARRLRCGPRVWDSAIISFAGVRTKWRQSGLGILLFKEMYTVFGATGIPFLDFGVEGGDAPKIYMMVLQRMRFQVLPLRTAMTHFTIVDGEGVPGAEWEVEVAEPGTTLDIGAWFGNDDTIVCADPTEAQWQHYWQDPRGRTLMLLHNRATGARGAAWVVRGEYVSDEGIRIVPTIDSIYLPGHDVRALRPLFHAAARWAGATGRTFVNAPNLSGFDDDALRSAGIKSSGKGFLAACCAPATPAFLGNARTTTVEVV